MKKVQYGNLSTLIGKYVSFKYNDRFYDRALVIKDEDNFRLLNNVYSCNDQHKDKSIYKYSYIISAEYEYDAIWESLKVLDEQPEFNIF